ncbi:ThiF family adenylyltransferase [Plantibacter sp. ME-Dv--P-095]|uniref:HesA/MoeB/ThiF family protein n=1 Tax=Plantibacter sp. ME-Dv--P-095 TaxID=3040299 RepID=UPI0025513CED|nr:ThiF family adenylyltransferase [Plantibacter sp. ME-Dv--P-095]
MPFVVLTADAARLIRESDARGGGVRLRRADADERFVADRVDVRDGTRIAVRVPSEYTALNWGDTSIVGQWARTVDDRLALTFLYLGRRPGAVIPFNTFHDLIPGVRDPGELLGLVIAQHTQLPDTVRALGAPEFTGWVVARDGVTPFEVQVEPDTFGLSQLPNSQALQQNTVTVVGVGSIGSTAATALAHLGYGRIQLIDPDRLLWHNLVRHQLGPESVGRFKVDALKASLDDTSRVFDDSIVTQITAHRLDVVEHAEKLHALLMESDAVLCAADGIAPRRTVNHIARLTSIPAVFACVLEDGAIGEILRSRPGTKFGCLLCHRAALREAGSLDPEANQERAYGTGDPHKPMTATPHDLRLVGDFAAKVVTATVLESRHGDASQRLPGEHLVLGLQPTRELPAPYDVTMAGEARWDTVPAPRTGCATCSAQ